MEIGKKGGGTGEIYLHINFKKLQLQEILILVDLWARKVNKVSRLNRLGFHGSLHNSSTPSAQEKKVAGPKHSSGDGILGVQFVPSPPKFEHFFVKFCKNSVYLELGGNIPTTSAFRGF